MKKKSFPPQRQFNQPGIETQMNPSPIFDDPEYKGSGKLKGKVALVTGGDSGIGRAVAISFAKEGAKVSIVYHNEHEDAERTAQKVREYDQECYLISGDIKDPDFCQHAVAKTLDYFHQLDILVNNAATQQVCESIEDISFSQLEAVFKTNIFSFFYFTKAALRFLKPGSSIINTTSVTAYRGSEHLVDYASTKAAIVGFTRSLARSLVDKEVRVNAVAPGPVWTPLILKRQANASYWASFDRGLFYFEISPSIPHD